MVHSASSPGPTTPTNAGSKFNDNVRLYFGTGSDVTIHYDGTDLIITPNVVGSGHVVISQGGGDGEAFAIRSSDVAHGLTSQAVTSSYLTIAKREPSTGGVRIQAIAEDDASNDQVFLLHAMGGQANTTKTTSGYGLVNIRVSEHNGSNSLANITADGNVFSVQARVGGSNVARLLVDEDGDLYSVTSAQTFDAEDDAALLDAYDTVRANIPIYDGLPKPAKDALDQKEAMLLAKGLLGGPVLGVAPEEQGMTNISRLAKLQTGGARQANARLVALEQENASLRARLDALERRP
jgi:hypothetical protein